MHPNTFFFANLFNQEKRDEVFVIMSFADEFAETWTKIIEPAVRDDLGLIPKRVDFNISGESIVHDIIDGIAHSRLVLADITSSQMKDRTGKVWPQRNGNVMWEVGIAHVMRMPNEVILVRADGDDSIFDLTQFRAFQYDEGDYASARKRIADLGKDRLRSLDQAASESVRRCAQSLDFSSWTILMAAYSAEDLSHPEIKNVAQAIGTLGTLPAITRLLEMGALRTSFVKVTPDLIRELANSTGEPAFRYRITPLGSAIVDYVAGQMDLLKPENIETVQGLHSQQ